MEILFLTISGVFLALLIILGFGVAGMFQDYTMIDTKKNKGDN